MNESSCPIIDAGLELEASDFTLCIGLPAVYRAHGRLHRGQIVTLDDFVQLVSWMPGGGENHEVGSFDYNGERFRYTVYLTADDFTIELRWLPKIIPSMDELGILPKFRELATKAPHGLFIVTGPTGSGKSTTLASIISHLNASDDLKIETLEDPIEYLHLNKKSLVKQREYGKHFDNFAVAIKAAMRHDPDVILVGEMRDPESIAATLTLSETGHKVFATLHTKDCAGSVSRILDGSASSDVVTLLGNSLVAVLAQQLVPTIDGKRAAAFELLVTTTAVKNHIRIKDIQHIRNEIRTGGPGGMISMDNSLVALVKARRITRDTAIANAFDPEYLREKLHQP